MKRSTMRFPEIATMPELGKEIFLQKYASPGEETYSDRAQVIAKYAASCESDENREKVENLFFRQLNAGDFIPGGRIIFGAGRNGGQYNLLNCYRLHPEDNVMSISKTIADMYRISCAGGGVGFNFSNVRPKGDDIQNIRYSSPGSVSVMKMINEIAEHVRAGASRRAALIGIMNVTHPDLLEFLEIKLNKKELNNFNISVGITNEFLDKIENNLEWVFTFNTRKYHLYEINRTSQDGTVTPIRITATSTGDAIERAKAHYLSAATDTFEAPKRITLMARDLWDLIWQNSFKSGDPGIYNVDLANSFTNVSYFEPDLQSPNPCSEIPLPPYGNCCLGHVNLSNMIAYDEAGIAEVDWTRLAVTIRAGVRFLDNILTVNRYPVEECADVGKRSRRIGLGTTGYHYMLLKLGYKYGSQKALEFTERLYETIRNEAYMASIRLSEERGPFPAFDSRRYSQEQFFKTLPPRIQVKIKNYGVRNAVMLTAAPVGTGSMLWGVSSGIEPIFAPLYIRRWRFANVWKEAVVADPLLVRFVKEGKNTEHFVGAHDVTFEEHIQTQATIQKYIDNSISKTANAPENASVEELSAITLKYIPYLKGFTIYRAGSKGQEPLQALPLTQENIDKYIHTIAPQNVKGLAGAMSCKLDGECG